jgi:hypothetical protein
VLLIASAEYTNFGKLPNPIRDARKLADSLRQIGFQVALVENADREQVNGRNYLIPTNADIPDEKRVATRAVELDEVMTALDASGSATRGLSVVQAKSKNSIIIYAAEAGSKAQGGLFTPILANAITAPGRSPPMSKRASAKSRSAKAQTPSGATASKF